MSNVYLSDFGSLHSFKKQDKIKKKIATCGLHENVFTASKPHSINGAIQYKQSHSVAQVRSANSSALKDNYLYQLYPSPFNLRSSFVYGKILETFLALYAAELWAHLRTNTIDPRYLDFGYLE